MRDSLYSVSQSGLYGGLRTFALQGLIHPLDVIKKRQQVSSLPVSQVVSSILQKEGFGGFWAGAWPKALKLAVQQATRWPLLTHLPNHLKGMNELEKQFVTGLVMAKVDAVTSKHLDRSQVRAALGRDVGNIWRAGHSGYLTYWCYLSVAWTSSLVALKYFEKKQARIQDDVVTGVQAGIVVSVVITPFDCLNTIKQAGGQYVGWRALYRSLPIQTTILVFHNIATKLTFRALD